jgi:hypothetical protein
MYELASEEVRTTAENIIMRHHRHLTDAHISYLFREKGWKTACGKTVLGKAAKRSEIDKLLSNREEDFIIMISRPDWERMNSRERESLLDHELCHCGAVVSNDGRIKWIVRQHDIGQFASILARYDFERQKLGNLIENPPDDELIYGQPTTRMIRREEGGEE